MESLPVSTNLLQNDSLQKLIPHKSDCKSIQTGIDPYMVYLIFVYYQLKHCFQWV